MVSDWGATHDSAQENANAGLDMEQPGDYIFVGEFRYAFLQSRDTSDLFEGGGVFGGNKLRDAVNKGEVSQAVRNFG